jgi:hypothetical protein
MIFDKRHHHHREREQQRRLRIALDQLLKEMDCMGLPELEKAVSGNTDITAAVVTKLQTAGGDPATEAAITAATTQIDTNTAALTAAIAPQHPTKPTYEHHGEGAIDSTQFPTAPFKTAAGVQLYFFVGDTDGGQPTAPASSEWSVYTGEVVAA